MSADFYVLDRFEGDVAVLELPGGGTVNVPRARVARGAVEGDILQGALDDPLGRPLRVAYQATRTALQEAQERLDRLRHGDPGGDITL